MRPLHHADIWKVPFGSMTPKKECLWRTVLKFLVWTRGQGRRTCSRERDGEEKDTLREGEAHEKKRLSKMSDERSHEKSVTLGFDSCESVEGSARRG